jgi:hypothetical protein
MKTFNVLAGIVIIAVLASFAPIGGEGFTMQVNDKVVIEHYFTSNASAPRVSLDVTDGNEVISISYNECGKIGTNRKLTLKDEAGHLLKEWKFTDSEKVNSIAIQGKEIMAFKNADRKTVTLTYSSKTVSTGRLLVVLTLENEAQTVSKK